MTHFGEELRHQGEVVVVLLLESEDPDLLTIVPGYHHLTVRGVHAKSVVLDSAVKILLRDCQWTEWSEKVLIRTKIWSSEFLSSSRHIVMSASEFEAHVIVDFDYKPLAAVVD